jgi:hypothetical protein
MYFCMFGSITPKMLNFYTQKWGFTWEQLLHNSGKDLQNSVQDGGLTRDTGYSLRFNVGYAS